MILMPQGKEFKLNIGTIDDLAIRENHEIEHMMNVISDQIRNVRRNKGNTQKLEEDLCYVQREHEIRLARARWIEKKRQQ